MRVSCQVTMVIMIYKWWADSSKQEFRTLTLIIQKFLIKLFINQAQQSEAQCSAERSKAKLLAGRGNAPIIAKQLVGRDGVPAPAEQIAS